MQISSQVWAWHWISCKKPWNTFQISELIDLLEYYKFSCDNNITSATNSYSKYYYHKFLITVSTSSWILHDEFSQLLARSWSIRMENIRFVFLFLLFQTENIPCGSFYRFLASRLATPSYLDTNVRLVWSIEPFKRWLKVKSACHTVTRYTNNNCKSRGDTSSLITVCYSNEHWEIAWSDRDKWRTPVLKTALWTLSFFRCVLERDRWFN